MDAELVRAGSPYSGGVGGSSSGVDTRQCGKAVASSGPSIVNEDR